MSLQLKPEAGRIARTSEERPRAYLTKFRSTGFLKGDSTCGRINPADTDNPMKSYVKYI